MEPVRKLPFATSLTLDVVRFGAAVMVATGHLTQGHFSAGWTDHTTLAVNAVGIFFVLSGFMIRYVTRLKYHRIGAYWIDRSARIYSVVLPAVLFTIVADSVSKFANPSYYLANWATNIDHPALRLFTNLTFTSQVWSHSIALFSNGPFWSLSYECIYYVLYGCAFYLAGFNRLALVIVVAAVAGPHILLLLPLWSLGCLVFDLYQRCRLTSLPPWLLQLFFVLAAVAGWVLWRPGHTAAFVLKSKLAVFFLAHHHQPINLRWTLDYYDVGIPAAFLLAWVAVTMESLRDPQKSRFTQTIRLMAEGTFPLYLIHFPLFVLIAALVPYNHGNPWFKSGMLALAVGLSVLMAGPTNRFKDYLRHVMKERWTRKPQVDGTVPASSAV